MEDELGEEVVFKDRMSNPWNSLWYNLRDILNVILRQSFVASLRFSLSDSLRHDLYERNRRGRLGRRTR